MGFNKYCDFTTAIKNNTNTRLFLNYSINIFWKIDKQN